MKAALLSSFLSLSLLTSVVSTSPAAEVQATPLLPDGKARPYRAQVLLLGQAMPACAKESQERMEDSITLYETNPPLASANDLESWLQSASGKKLMSQRWHALCINLPDAPSGSISHVETYLKDKVTSFVWLDKSDATDADALSKKLRAALLKGSTPWAELPALEKRDPAKLLQSDDALANPDALPIVPSKTATIYRAEEGQWQFNLHSFIAHHEGKFWAIWSSGRVNEDSSSQMIRYATSTDGLAWSEAGIAAPDPDGESGPLRWLASGLYVENGKLYALGCLNSGNVNGRIWSGAKLMRQEWTKDGWKDDGLFADNCMVYFPPLKVAGRDFFVWRDERAHFFTARSLPQKGQWEVQKHPNFPPDYRMSETAAYADGDGTLHLIIRDQGKTKRLYHSLSFDQGSTWTLPVKTNYPDAVSKNAAGRLSNGWYYLINNPKTSGLRDPLTISFSKDGWTFSSPKILRRDSPDRRYPGGAKPKNSFQYADAMEHDGKLWVIYATNKEDIEVSAFDISTLIAD